MAGDMVGIMGIRTTIEATTVTGKIPSRLLAVPCMERMRYAAMPKLPSDLMFSQQLPSAAVLPSASHHIGNPIGNRIHMPTPLTSHLALLDVHLHQHMMQGGILLVAERIGLIFG